MFLLTTVQFRKKLKKANHLKYHILLINMTFISDDRSVTVTTAWCVLGLRMQERPPAMEGSCEYNEKVAVDKRQGVVLQLGKWAWG
jgi:hypothetical protein